MNGFRVNFVTTVVTVFMSDPQLCPFSFMSAGKTRKSLFYVRVSLKLCPQKIGESLTVIYVRVQIWREACNNVRMKKVISRLVKKMRSGLPRIWTPHSGEKLQDMQKQKYWMKTRSTKRESIPTAAPKITIRIRWCISAQIQTKLQGPGAWFFFVLEEFSFSVPDLPIVYFFFMPHCVALNFPSKRKQLETYSRWGGCGFQLLKEERFIVNAEHSRDLQNTQANRAAVDSAFPSSKNLQSVVFVLRIEEQVFFF